MSNPLFGKVGGEASQDAARDAQAIRTAMAYKRIGQGIRKWQQRGIGADQIVGGSADDVNLRFRRRLFLFIPGIVASLWGGGPLDAARARGIDPSSRYYHFLAGPWPLVLAVTALVLVWVAFGKAAEKAARDREEVQYAIAP